MMIDFEEPLSAKLVLKPVAARIEARSLNHDLTFNKLHGINLGRRSDSDPRLQIEKHFPLVLLNLNSSETFPDFWIRRARISRLTA